MPNFRLKTSQYRKKTAGRKTKNSKELKSIAKKRKLGYFGIYVDKFLLPTGFPQTIK
jgi:hypothetical protein